MRRILAIATISMRTAFRSKVFLTLLTMLLLVIVGIPLTIKGDGTIDGYARILIEYTLNFVRFILAAAAIWAGCASISQEVENKQIQMTATKPVRPIEIWLGKWMGIVAPIALLALLSGGIVYGILAFNLRASQLSEIERRELRRDILVGRSRILPQEPQGLEEQVSRAISDVLDDGRLPPNVSEYELRESIRNTLIVRRQTIDPQQTSEWRFALPNLPADRAVAVEFNASSAALGGVEIPGVLRIIDSDGTRLHEEKMKLATGTTKQIDLPGTIFAGEKKVAVEYENLSNQNAVIFPRRDSILLLTHSSGFELNYLRTVLIMIMQLAFLSAIAVTMGAIFSTPVATFAAVFMLILVFMDGYIHEMARKIEYSGGGHSHGHHQEAEPEAPGFVDKTIHHMFVAIDFAAAPLRQPDPLELCSTGIYVSWRMLGNVALFHVLVYSGGLAIIGSSIFGRRELALPLR